ncbi:helix-turn-helix domain-containing protein [Caulobacter sp. NIBR2454]|uniref:helix-turn-helix domain-containing protein n=1 Tax=Caulobacter sp. NIBR2454 TaxID=3015996 RepID=UPI0022B65015|nr:AraC family transcriptional regulator [Caulobacter sp. NIBR2454]
MTYQVAASTFSSYSAAGAPVIAELLANAQRTLESDLDAARGYVARVAALLNGEQSAEKRAAVSGGLAPWQAKRIEAFIEENLDSTISVENMAGLVRLSAGHFGRAFKDSFGETPHSYVMRRRVERAKRLMLSTREPLSQIAIACGFADQAHFSNLFRKQVGATPNAWRRANWIETGFAQAA